MPCQELFDRQIHSYKKKILSETKYLFSIEAGSRESWKKYVTREECIFGIDDFGKSAPYKNLYEFFGLEANLIKNKIKKIINRKL